MKNNKYRLAAGALFFSAFSGLALPISNTFAEGATSYLDPNTQACVIENYNAEHGTTITSIEEVDFSQVTVLNCSNRNLQNFYGITLFPNLERLDISYNQNLAVYDMNFSQNTKLKEINLKGISYSWYNFSDNPNLETILTDHDLWITSSAFVERLNSNTEYSHGMRLSQLKFIKNTATPITNEEGYPAEFNSTNRIISYKNKVPYYVSVADSDGHIFHIQARGGFMRYAVHLNGDETIQEHNPIFVENGCEETTDGYYYCEDTVYYGDTIDTDSIIENTLSKIFNLSKYQFSKVTIVPPTANLDLAVDTDTLKKGTALTDASFTVHFYFDLAKESGSSSTNGTDTTTPETGAFTTESSQGASAVAIIGAIIAGLTTSFVAYPKIRKMISKE